MKTKVCIKCNEEKTLAEFGNDKQRPDGKHTYCLDCRRKAARIKRSQTPKEELQERRREQYERYRPRELAWQLDYQARNKEKTRRDQSRYHSDRWKNDPLYRFKNNVRNRVRKGMQTAAKNPKYNDDEKAEIRKNRKKTSTEELLGTDFLSFKEYIENLFIDEMTWENQGDVWEIDHTIPIDSIDWTDNESILKVMNYKNQKPMGKSDNRKKGNSFY